MVIKKEDLPRHVAIIMDGNGRWGECKFGIGKRTKGHIQGVKRAREIIKCSDELGIQSLRLWGYSTDNWKREDNEVNILMWLFRRFIVREADDLDVRNVCVTFVGRRADLPRDLQRVMGNLERQTMSNTGLRLEIALNYGGLQSIHDAVIALINNNQAVTEVSLLKVLYPDIPAPDFIVRTSGEKRTSGFQPLAVHAEWEFVDTLWPDFSADEYVAVLQRFKDRNRRFGGVATGQKIAR